MTHRIFLKLWLDMRLGAAVTTGKQNKHRANGKLLILQNQRRPDWFNQMLRSCWLVFLMLMELCTRNLFLLGKPRIDNFICRCWKDYMIVYGKKRPEMWSSDDWFLHHDNVPAHMALGVQQFFWGVDHEGYPSSSLFIRPCAMRLFPVPL